jgi:hypothetical protein
LLSCLIWINWRVVLLVLAVAASTKRCALRMQSECMLLQQRQPVAALVRNWP